MYAGLGFTPHPHHHRPRPVAPVIIESGPSWGYAPPVETVVTQAAPAVVPMAVWIGLAAVGGLIVGAVLKR
jgi:hypothetical protein